MNDEVRQKLCEIIALLKSERHTTLDARRIKSFLLDLCGKHRREINVLTVAISEGFVEQLMSESHGDMTATIRRLSAQLSHDHAMEDSAATWALTTWAIALNKVQPRAIQSPALATPGRQAASQNLTLKTPKGPPATVTGPAVPAICPQPSATVCRFGLGDYKSIKEAIDALPDGSTILIRGGEYSEHLYAKRNCFLLPESSAAELKISLTINSKCVLSLSGFDQMTLSLRDGEVRCENCKIKTLEITPPLYFNEPIITLTHCDVENFEDRSSPGQSDMTAHHCTFRTKTLRLNRCKYLFTNCWLPSATIRCSGKVTVRACHLESAYWEIKDDGVVEFENCRISDSPGVAICVKNYGVAKLHECEIANNKVGIDVVKGTASLTRCQFTGNDVPVRYSNDSAGVITDCDFQLNRQQMSISPSAQVQLNNISP